MPNGKRTADFQRFWAFLNAWTDAERADPDLIDSPGAEGLRSNALAAAEKILSRMGDSPGCRDLLLKAAEVYASRGVCQKLGELEKQILDRISQHERSLQTA